MHTITCFVRHTGGRDEEGHPIGYVQLEHFWLENGPYSAPMSQQDTGFVLTSSTKENVRRIARVLVTRQYPVLLQVCVCVCVCARARV